MNLDDVVACLAKEAGASNIELNSQGRCCFRANGRHELWLERSLEPERFFLFGAVCSVPEDSEAEILRWAMLGNLFQQETGEAVLGLEPDMRLLILSQHVSEKTLSETAFLDLLRTFVAYMEFWALRTDDLTRSLPPILDSARHMRGLKEERLHVFFG